MMSRLGIFPVLVAVMLWTAAALASPPVLSHQGRLLDAADQPVNGSVTLIYQIFDVPVGGAPLWTEDHAGVTVTDGLFAVGLGATVPLSENLFSNSSSSGGVLYLQVQVAGESPMMPRIRIAQNAFAVSSTRVTGDIQTAPGLVIAGDTTTNYYATFGEKVNAGLHAAGSALASGASRITNDCDDTDAEFALGHSQGSTTGVAAIHSSVDSTGLQLVHTEPGYESSLRAVGRGKDIRKSISIVLRRQESSSSQEVELSADTAETGISLRKIDSTPARISTNFTVGKQTRADFGQRYDADGDGTPETSMSATLERKSGSIIYLDREGNEVVRSMVGVDSTKGVISTDHDSDDDGLSDGEASLRVVPGTSSMAIKTKGTGADKDRVMSITATTDGFSSAVHRSDYDDDGDGVPEQEISQTLTPVSSNVAIKTKGTAADANRVIMTTTSDSVVTDLTYEFTNSLLMPALMKAKEKANRTKCSNNLRYQSPVATNEAELAVDSAGSGLTMTADSDGDGVAEAKISGRIIGGQFTGGPGTITLQLADVDDDGVPESEISQTVLPTTSSVAIKTKGTGADKDRVISSTTDTSKAVTVHSADTDGDGLADRVIREQCDDDDASITVARGSGEIKIKHKGWDGTIKGRMAIEEGGAIQVDFAGDGVGFVSQRFGVGVLSPTNPIEHSSGAHLTVGGVWTNASDANLKENFQPVDGAELLEKIEQLPISEWNYKTESNKTKHIGPTAQDFQAAFGVGSDGKSISTIDPSGIALAAIKELSKRNADLAQQNAELAAKMAQLQQMVEKLAEQNAK